MSSQYLVCLTSDSQSAIPKNIQANNKSILSALIHFHYNVIFHERMLNIFSEPFSRFQNTSIFTFNLNRDFCKQKSSLTILPSKTIFSCLSSLGCTVAGVEQNIEYSLACIKTTVQNPISNDLSGQPPSFQKEKLC